VNAFEGSGLSRPAQAPQACPSCGSRVVEELALGCCPNCGRHWRLARVERAVSVLDWMAGGAACFIAVVVCVPSTWILFETLNGNLADKSSAMLAVGWHSWVWGLPLAAVVFTWRDNVLHNRGATEGLLKTYYRVQLFTLLVPFIGMLSLAGLVGLARL
jgi:predicted RNA-binding Zn-ribbon protein involved in translation (DUF1610 family)